MKGPIPCLIIAVNIMTLEACASRQQRLGVTIARRPPAVVERRVISCPIPNTVTLYPPGVEEKCPTDGDGKSRKVRDLVPSSKMLRSFLQRSVTRRLSIIAAWPSKVPATPAGSAGRREATTGQFRCRQPRSARGASATRYTCSRGPPTPPQCRRRVWLVQAEPPPKSWACH